MIFRSDATDPRHAWDPGSIFIEDGRIVAITPGAGVSDADHARTTPGAGVKDTARATPGAGVKDTAPTTPGAGVKDRDDSRITLDSEPHWPDARVLDRRSCWILPGFVQTHVHLCQTLFRGAAEGLTLYRWLEQVVWPWETALEDETMECSAALGLHLLTAGGTTTLLDMGTTHRTEVIARAAARSGIAAFLGPAVMDRGPQTELLRDEATTLREIDDLSSRWHGHDAGRIRIALCPRFVPSVSDRLYDELVTRPDYRDFLIHTHGSETREEVEQVRALAQGRTPIEHLTAWETAADRLQIAHAVWISHADRARLKETGSAVCHCPSSNFKLGSGSCDVRALQEMGIRVGLGADGAACNNRLDPWLEMRQAAFVQSALRGPESVDPGAILRLATLGGAEALRIESETGSLAAGKWADFIVIDPSLDPGACPGPLDPQSPAAWLVYAGSAALVRETWARGRPIYQKEEESDWRKEWFQRLIRARRTLHARADRFGARAARSNRASHP